MVLKIENISAIKIYEDSFINISDICPGCGETVKFLPFDDCFDLYYQVTNNYIIFTGQRYCPNTNCNTHIFFEHHIPPVGRETNKITPRNFKSQNISLIKLPEEIRNSFKEAMLCYNSGCFIASAILIRKVLENICLLNNSKGKNLHERIKSLKDKLTLSTTLYNAMFELKYLGNDAAHFESKHFEKINQKEAELGLTILSEILRSIYEHEDLINSFKALKHS